MYVCMYVYVYMMVAFSAPTGEVEDVGHAIMLVPPGIVVYVCVCVCMYMMLAFSAPTGEVEDVGHAIMLVPPEIVMHVCMYVCVHDAGHASSATPTCNHAQIHILKIIRTHAHMYVCIPGHHLPAGHLTQRLGSEPTHPGEH